MFSTCELVAPLLRICQGGVEGKLGAGRDVEGASLGSLWPAAKLCLDPAQQDRRLEAVELLKGGLDQAVGLGEQRQEQVFGVELVVAQTQQQLLDSSQRFACFVSESFERDQENSSRPPRLGVWDNLDSWIIRVCATGLRMFRGEPWSGL